MKLFAINETEWIAANTEEEAIEFKGLIREDVETIDEIPENEWDQEVECYSPEELEESLDTGLVKKTIRELMQYSIKSGLPSSIMTEDYE